jgi:ssDNA-binding Zn-finger/Zn-ribbon topoisomerase 1
MWRVAADCPRCAKPLVLRQSPNFRPFLACSSFPKCRFTSPYDKLIHALLDRIILLQDTLEDAGIAVERTLP